MSPETHTERALDAITVGVRHRQDLGDIDELANSIKEIGMLQPITITPDGVLVCGRRRLEAVRRLGWHTVKVWIRSGISDRLTELLAQQDENSLHKPLSLLEQTALYDELKELYAEEGRRRQEASRFGVGAAEPVGAPLGGDSGADGPSAPAYSREARYQASRVVTGKGSFQRLDRVKFLQAVAGDPFQPSTVRELAGAELAAVGDGAPVEPAYRKVRAAIELAAHPQASDDLDHLAAEALERVRQTRARKGLRAPQKATTEPTAEAAPPKHRTLRSFLLTWTELGGWSQHYDLGQLARDLKDEEYARFDSVVTETVAFRDRLWAARSTGAAQTGG